MGKPKNWSKEMQQQICKEYLEGESSLDIGRKLGVSSVSIIEIIKKNNIRRRDLSHACQNYKLNEEFFFSIDNEQKAYWLGFISADGHLDINKCSLSISLSNKDKKHLATFLNHLNSNHPIKEYNYSYGNFVRIYIGNKRLSTSLKIFMDNNKTHTLRFPAISKALEHHFIRGYFDGDGCVSGNRKNPQFSITSNLFFLKELKKRFLLIDLTDTKNDVRHKDKPEIQTLRYCGVNNLIKLHNYLYKNATLYLDRKKEKFENVIKN